MAELPTTISVTQCDELLHYLRHHPKSERQHYKKKRNYLAVLLMLDAGLRVGEVTKLLVSDLTYNEAPVESICIRKSVAKTHKERWIPTSERLREAITEMSPFWKAEEKPFQTMPAFLSRPHGYGISVRQLERIVGNASFRSIGRVLHPHLLRHTFATRLMQVTNTRVVQQLLGHANLTSTQIYTHPTQIHKREAIDKMSEVH